MVNVDAHTRYEAFGLALPLLRRCRCLEIDKIERMTIDVVGVNKKESFRVSREEFEAWLSSPSRTSMETAAKDYIKVLLHRQPPDRDMKRIMGQR